MNSMNPTFVVSLDGREPYEVTSIFKDLTMWEQEAHRKGLPGVGDAPLTWAAHVSYLASRRCGRIEAEMPFEAYEDALLNIEFETGGEEEETTPTQPGH